MPLPKTDGIDFGALIEAANWTRIGGAFAAMHPADVAAVIDAAPVSARARLFSLVPDDRRPDVLSELESELGLEEILESLSDRELSRIIEDLPPDDAADVVADLPDDRSRQVLSLLPGEDSEDVRQLLRYHEETAGGIMTTDVVAMRGNQTVEEALRAIALVDSDERFVYAYVVDDRNILLGYVDVWELLRQKDRSRPLADIAHREVVSVPVDADQEEAARRMSHYRFSALPVVDAGGRLVGRITADDVMDVMKEEASEDIFRLAGSDDAELEHASALRTSMVRLPWLLVTLLGGFVTSAVLRQFHARVTDVIILAAFVPIVLAMGGNTGIQSSTLVVRSIALHGLKGRSIFRLLRREILVGALMGAVCGAIIGWWSHFMAAVSGGADPGISPFLLAATVGGALFCAMAFAAGFGALVPVLLERLRVDPAVASGPFVTIANDISALLIYFAVTVCILHHLHGL